MQRLITRWLLEKALLGRAERSAEWQPGIRYDDGSSPIGDCPRKPAVN